jgi:FPC/CPF motif-containing protein YcgG
VSIEKETAVSAELVNSVIGDLPDWGGVCLEELVDGLLASSPAFPCTFAVSAAKKNSLRFGFVDDLDDERSWSSLAEVLGQYLDIYQSLSRETSLVMFFRPERSGRTLEEYNSKFWDVLRFLHHHDPQPWPADVPSEPDHPMWEFVFQGTPLFVVCNTPAHQTRRSRHSSCFLITFQPRWVFEGLEPDQPRGAAARRVIRRRLRAFDETEPSPHLGNYGDPWNREWRQYFLPDDNESELSSACPLHQGADNDPAISPG